MDNLVIEPGIVVPNNSQKDNESYHESTSFTEYPDLDIILSEGYDTDHTQESGNTDEYVIHTHKPADSRSSSVGASNYTCSLILAVNSSELEISIPLPSTEESKKSNMEKEETKNWNQIANQSEHLDTQSEIIDKLILNDSVDPDTKLKYYAQSTTFNGFSLPSNKCNKQSLGNSTASCSAPTNPATLRLEHKNFSTISVKLPWLFKKTFGSSKTELLEKSKAELKYPKGTNKYTLSSRNGSSVESYEKGGYHSVSSMDLAKELSLSGKMLDISAETNNIDRSTYFEQNEKDSYEDQLDRSCSQRTTCNDPLELYSKGSQTYPDKENICEAIDLEADYHANEKSIPTMNSYYFKSNLSLSSVFRPMRSGFFTRGGQIEAFTAGSGSELDLVVQRLLSWYYILTGVSNYFGELAKHTTDSLKHITLIEQRVKLEGLTQMPFSDTKDLGVKRILRDIKVASEVNSLRKNRFTNVLVDELCPKLRSLSKVSKDSAKSYIVYMKSTYPPVKKYFKQTASSLKRLETAINEFHLDKKQAVDPWLAYIAYIKQLKQKYGAQNHVNKVFQLKLAEIRETDMKIFTEFKKVMQDFLDVYSKLYIAYDFNVLKMIEYIRAVPDSLEWDAFEKRYQAELNAPNGFCGTQSLETMNYPYKASMYSKIVREGRIEREKGVIKAFSSCYAVITGTGFLHCFSSESAVPDAAPEISIFLPNSAIKHTSGKRFTITVSKGFTKERHHFRCLHSRLSLDWIYELKVASAPS